MVARSTTLENYCILVSYVISTYFKFIQMPITETIVSYLMHPNIYVMKCCHKMSETWMKNHLLSDNILQRCKSIMPMFTCTVVH